MLIARCLLRQIVTSLIADDQRTQDSPSYSTPLKQFISTTISANSRRKLLPQNTALTQQQCRIYSALTEKTMVANSAYGVHQVKLNHGQILWLTLPNVWPYRSLAQHLSPIYSSLLYHRAIQRLPILLDQFLLMKLLLPQNQSPLQRLPYLQTELQQ